MHELKGMNVDIGAIKDMWLVVSKIEGYVFAKFHTNQMFVLPGSF